MITPWLLELQPSHLFQGGKRKIGYKIKVDGAVHCIKTAKALSEISSKTSYLCFVGQNSVLWLPIVLRQSKM